MTISHKIPAALCLLALLLASPAGADETFPRGFRGLLFGHPLEEYASLFKKSSRPRQAFNKILQERVGWRLYNRVNEELIFARKPLKAINYYFDAQGLNTVSIVFGDRRYTTAAAFEKYFGEIAAYCEKLWGDSITVWEPALAGNWKERIQIWYFAEAGAYLAEHRDSKDPRIRSVTLSLIRNNNPLS